MLKLKVNATRFSLAIFILFFVALLEDEIKLPQTEKIIFGGNINDSFIVQTWGKKSKHRL